MDLDRYAAPASLDDGWHFLLGVEAWSFEDFGRWRYEGEPCPVCSNRRLDRPVQPLGRLDYCLACDASGLDGRVTFPGLPVDYAPDPDWAASSTCYVPDEEGLAGGVEGVGKRVKPKKLRRKRAG